MKRSVSAVLTCVSLFVAAGSVLADFELPLQLRPGLGRDGMRFVSNGVPLLVGQAMETDELHVIGPDDKEVPAQFRVLARWWQGDNSIRWVLVDFPRKDSGAVAGYRYKLVGRKAKASRPTTAMALEETDDVIRINTGKALFEIDKKHFNLLNRIAIDADGNGEFSAGEMLVTPDPANGSVTEDPEGRKYYSSAGTEKVEIVDSGPVRVTVMAKGRHISEEPGAFEPGLYGFEVYLTFHVGTAHCDLDAILTNNFAKPIGEPNFKDWSLVTRLAGQSDQWAMQTWNGKGQRLSGGAAESALLYQDSVGTDLWERNTGIKVGGWPKPPQPKLSTFRGYRLYRLKGDGLETGEIADSGDFATGVVRCVRGQAECVVQPRYFWQQFPSAIQFGQGGVVRVSPLPGEYSTLHWIEDSSAKAQELRLDFALGGEKAGGGSSASKEFLTRVFALPSPEHCGAAGALSDLGPYMNHPKIADAVKTDEYFDLAKTDERLLSADSSYGNGYGWQVFGCRWFEMAGHSPWNYEPLATSGSLWMHLLVGNDDRLIWGMRVDRHARDVRAYLVDDRDNLALWKTWNDYTRNATVEHFSRLKHGQDESKNPPDPDTGPHPYPRVIWPLPNMSHLNLDEVYDLYLMTGDPRAMRCMRMIADHGIAWTLLRPGTRRVYRDEGWCLRTLMRYYELTGDKRYEPYVRQCIDRIWNDVNKAGPWTPGGGTWYQAIYARGATTAWRADGDERMRDLAIGCADWAMTYEVTPSGYPAPAKKAPPWTMTPEQRVGPKGQRGMCPSWANGYHIDMFAYAYQQTGDPKYLDAMDFAFAKNARTWWLGYFPTAMYMTYGPRQDKVAPAAVTDLAAQAVGEKVTLTWTAPGDDGDQGAASVYQIKYAAKPILDFVPFPGKRDTHITFWGSENVVDEPAPQAAGTKQTWAIGDLKPGTYYFALKARDECSNQSPISNVVTVEVK